MSSRSTAHPAFAPPALVGMRAHSRSSAPCSLNNGAHSLGDFRSMEFVGPKIVNGQYFSDFKMMKNPASVMEDACVIFVSVLTSNTDVGKNMRDAFKNKNKQWRQSFDAARNAYKKSKQAEYALKNASRYVPTMFGKKSAQNALNSAKEEKKSTWNNFYRVTKDTFNNNFSEEERLEMGRNLVNEKFDNSRAPSEYKHLTFR